MELEGTGGIRVLSRLTGCPPDQVRIGLPVEVSFEDVRPEVTLPVLRPRRETHR